jgi:hypothetical protein
VRSTFEERLVEMNAAVRPGLRDFRYQDLSTKIRALEEELCRRFGSSS